MIEIQNLRHSYKEHEALKGLSLSIERGEIFGFLGPNGSGKSTLFRILATSILPTSASVVTLEGLDIVKDYRKVREIIGIVFQSPSLDGRLSVRENLIHQGRLYGLSGSTLRERCREMLGRLGLEARAKDLTGTLSGGLKRRVELAKGLLHRPKVLILDEPSTGLDPGTRRDMWHYLKNVHAKDGVTILVTTHLMEEAEECGRVAILHDGNLVRVGTPQDLKKKVAHDIVVVQTKDPKTAADKIKSRLGLEAAVVEGEVHVEHEKGPALVAQLVESLPGEVEAVTFRRPTLEDVFLHETGHSLR